MGEPEVWFGKKGAPTNYYLVVAPERVRVNCELIHVDVVLCCDPKASPHTNPLEGLNKGRLSRLGIKRYARNGLATHSRPASPVRAGE